MQWANHGKSGVLLQVWAPQPQRRHGKGLSRPFPVHSPDQQTAGGERQNNH